MRVWKPCPECGKCPWRPLHAVEAHGVELPETGALEALQRWADRAAKA